jgi:predicted acyltransferase
MLAMVSSGLGLERAAGHFPDSPAWRLIGTQVTHARWRGCHAWDLIMPAFMFIAGAAIAWSLASRRAAGSGRWALLLRALRRSILLIVLGILVTSNTATRTEFTFFNVLCQIGLAYPFAFALATRPARTQILAGAAILTLWWLWFASWPPPGADFDYASVGVPPDWGRLTGWAAHWDLNANPAAAVDRWFLNLFPRSQPFRFRPGGGTTLNFVPSVATMILGILAGEWLRAPMRPEARTRRMIVTGLALLVLGTALDPAILPLVRTDAWTTCPVVKRLWTPAWVLYSGGWTLLGMATLYWLVDVRGRREWTFPFVVVGTNSIAMYLLAALGAGWVSRTLNTHAGPLFDWWGGPILDSALVLGILWLACLWLYRKRIFVRL